MPPLLCGATCPRRSRGAAQAQTGLRWGRQPRSEPRGSAQAGGKGRRRHHGARTRTAEVGDFGAERRTASWGGARGEAERGRAGTRAARQGGGRGETPGRHSSISAVQVSVVKVVRVSGSVR